MKQFGERLKKLRKEMKITQEELASGLGISFQAVSKWENALGFPDISLLPAIANFFGVTSDYLLGIELNNTDEIIERALEEAEQFTHTGELDKSIFKIEEMLKCYPNEHRLLVALVDYKIMRWSDDREWLEDIEKMAKLILRDCTVDKLRHKNIANLAIAYSFGGESEKARKTAELLPENAYSKRDLLSIVVRGKERIKYIPECILADAESLLCNCLSISKHNIFWGDAQIALDVCERALKIIDALGDEGYLLYMKASAYEDMALAYGKLDNPNMVFKCLKNALENHIKIKKILNDGETQYISPLFAGMIFSNKTLSFSSDADGIKRFENYILNSNILKKYYNDERFKAITQSIADAEVI